MSDNTISIRRVSAHHAWLGQMPHPCLQRLRHMGRHLFLERPIEHGPGAQKSRNECGCDDPRLEALLHVSPLMALALEMAAYAFSTPLIPRMPRGVYSTASFSSSSAFSNSSR